jgi:hypothetical protein
MGPAKIFGMVRPGGVFVDVKSAFEPQHAERGVRYWSL